MSITEIEVKSGMELAMQNGSGNSYEIVIVEKVTPTGRISIKGHRNHFDKQGYEMSTDKVWYKAHLYPLTDKLRAKIQREAWIRTLNNIEWKKLSDKTLEAVINAISRK